MTEKDEWLDDGLKLCPRCCRLLSLDKFATSSRTGNARKQCEDCTQGVEPAARECSKCHKVFPVETFPLNTNGSGYVYRRSACAACHLASRKRPTRKGPRKLALDKLYDCRRCEKELPADRYRIVRGSVLSYCRLCEREYHRDRYIKRNAGKPYASRSARAKQKSAALYDYAFARDVLQLTTAQAIEWVANGYRDLPLDTVEKWVAA